jgi:[ribosomal protein S5]-alanine N-acetyltransferase
VPVGTPIMQNLETARLLIRTFLPDDLEAIHRILDQSFGDGTKSGNQDSLRERSSWLDWSILSQEWLPRLHQPPYGDRAVTLRSTGALIGAVGLVPLLAPFGQIPELRHSESGPPGFSPEVGLFWVIDPAQRGHGYATEAARALVDTAFRDLHLARIVATTEFNNAASQSVMRHIGMTLLRNPLPEPAWLQIVGVLSNPGERDLVSINSRSAWLDRPGILATAKAVLLADQHVHRACVRHDRDDP